MKLGQALEGVLADIQDLAGYLWQRGWAERNAGNLSVDVTDEVLAAGVPPLGPWRPCPVPGAALAGRWLLVSATGARFRELARSPERGLLLLRVAEGLDGYAVACAAAGAAPTSELSAHLGIHAMLRAAGSRHRAVLHTHPVHLIALSHLPGLGEAELNRALWSMMPEVRVVLPEGLGLAPYRLPGGAALAEATVAALSGRRVVLWALHGCLAVEGDVLEAFDLLDVLDKAARLYLLCRGAGFEPRGIAPAELDALGELARRLGLGP